MKKLIGMLVLVSLVIVTGTAYAAQLNIGSRYYTKFLDRNTYDVAKYVTTGNGVGIRSELELTLNGQVSDRAEMGGRILTVWAPPGITPDYSDWGGWYNGGANLWQVRGMWLTFRPATIPTLKSVLIGSTDLGMFSPWTIGKIRWIDRDNARVIYGEGALGPIKYGVGTTPMPSWWAQDWNTGPNPRSAWATGANIAFAPNPAVNVKLNMSHVLAVQADLTPPTDETKALTRFDNSVEILEIGYQPNPVYNVSVLYGLSNYKPNQAIMGAAQTWWNQWAYGGNVSGNVVRLDATADDPLGIGLTLKGEYFNVSPDFVSIMASRRETKVLISEGHVRYGANTNGSTWAGDVGYSPSANLFMVDNGITDWNETNYQSCIGLNGITIIPEYRAGALGVKGEVSVMSNGLNSQSVDTTKYFWSAAKVNQSSNLAAVRVDYLIPFRNGLNVFAKYKLANWSDGVDTSIATDDLAMNDTEMYAGAKYQLTDEIGVTGGYKTLAYISKGNGTSADTKTYDLSGGMVFAEVKANVGGVDMAWAYEKVDGKENVSGATVKDMRIKATAEIKI